MVSLSQEIENTIQKYRGENALEQYKGMQTTELLRRGPEETLEELEPLTLQHVDEIYERNDTAADALEELYELRDQREEAATNYLLQRDLIDELQDITLE